MTETEVVSLGGFVGNFHVQVSHKQETSDISAGAIIVATGFELFDARQKPELGYGVYPQVISTLDFENAATACRAA
jgi:heterodisulfide reductase subunit A